MNAIKTTHNLDFEVAPPEFINSRFRVGTCTGLWGSTDDSYYILAVVNNKKHNGHLQDVFEWFEYSCKRDNRNLIVLEVWNRDFYKHLIRRGFIPLDKEGKNVIKIFNKKAYKRLLLNENEVLTKELKTK
jgi:hypothetical protein